MKSKPATIEEKLQSAVRTLKANGQEQEAKDLVACVNAAPNATMKSAVIQDAIAHLPAPAPEPVKAEKTPKQLRAKKAKTVKAVKAERTPKWEAEGMLTPALLLSTMPLSSKTPRTVKFFQDATKLGYSACYPIIDAYVAKGWLKRTKPEHVRLFAWTSEGRAHFAPVPQQMAADVE